MLVSQIQSSFIELHITMRSKPPTAFCASAGSFLLRLREQHSSWFCAHWVDKRGRGAKGDQISCSAGTELKGNVLWELFPFITHL